MRRFLFLLCAALCVAAVLGVHASTDIGTPDAYEVDDTPEQVASMPRLAPGPWYREHTLHVSGDVDWMPINLQAHVTYTIYTLRLLGGTDTVIWLYKGTAAVAFSDNQSTTDRSSKITYTPTTGGTYLLKVHDFAFRGGPSMGYAVSVEANAQSVTCGPDAFEPDVSVTAAPELATGVPQAHSFHDEGDQDRVRLTTVTGATYTIETRSLGVNADTGLTLSRDGHTLFYDDDGGGNRASKITFVADGPRLVATVSQADRLLTGCDTNYELLLTRIDNPQVNLDAYEPDDEWGSARQPAVGVIGAPAPAERHTFHTKGDEDWLKVTGTVGSRFVVETSNLETRADTVLELYGAGNDTALQTSDDDGGGRASALVFELPSSAGAWIRARSYSPDVFGPGTGYDLRVTRLEGCEPGGEADTNNTPEAAWRVWADVGTVAGQADCAGDVDWFKFSVPEGNQYVLRTANLGSGSDTVMRLYAKTIPNALSVTTDTLKQIAVNDDANGSRASEILGIAPSGDEMFVKVQQKRAAAFGPSTKYGIQLSNRSATDPYEPDVPVPAESLVLTGGTATQARRSIQSAYDVDWATFRVSPGRQYLIETLNLGSRADTVLQLYAADGTTVLASDDNGGGGRASLLRWTAPAGATSARVKITERAFGVGTEYDLRVTEGADGGDRFEPDDTPALAGHIQSPTTQAGRNFHSATDVDWVRFDAAQSAVYVIQAIAVGSRSDARLQLYAADHTTLLATDDNASSRSARITWRAATSGPLFIRVQHPSGAAGPTTSYDLSLTDSSSGGDSYEPDNVPSEARRTVIGATSPGHTFHYLGDEDWTRVALSAGERYTFQTQGGAVDTVLSLYDVTGTSLLASDDDHGGGLYGSSIVGWAAPASGDYLLQVRSGATPPVITRASYSLTVIPAWCQAQVEASEPDDRPAAAAPIAVGVAQHRNFACEGDQDWAVLTTTPGARYAVWTEALGAGVDTQVTVFAADGTTEVASNDDSAPGTPSSRVVFDATGTTHYVRVRSHDPRVYGATRVYDLQVAMLSVAAAPDVYEPDNAPGQARTIRSDSVPQTGHNTHLPGDQDWMTFTVTGGAKACVIETFNLDAHSDTEMFLFSQDGMTQVAADSDSGPGVAALITQTSLAVGTYYLMVEQKEAASGADTGYDVRVACASPVTDAFEPDDTRLTAKAAMVGVTHGPHNAGVPGDQDWISFAAAAGRRYRIETLNLDSFSDTFIRVYNPMGVLIASNDDYTAGSRTSRLDLNGTTLGTYYVQVTQANAASYGFPTQYSIKVTQLVVAAVTDGVTVDLSAVGPDVMLGVHTDRTDIAAMKVRVLAKPDTMTLRSAGAADGTGVLQKAQDASVPGDMQMWSVAADGAAPPAVEAWWTLSPSSPGDVLSLPYDLTLVMTDGTIVTDAGMATATVLAATPKVSAVTPATFANAGETALAIAGFGLELGGTIALVSGNYVAPAGSVTYGPGGFVVTMPAGTKPGRYKLEWTNPDGQSAYFGPLTVTQGSSALWLGSVTPGSGVVTGGLPVHLKGSGFAAGMSVAFGGVAAPAVSVVDGAHAVVVPPPHPAGAVDVTLTSGATSFTAALVYQYVDAPADGTQDTDGDGIPDAFELSLGLDARSAADATDDADGDGVTNLREYQAGTDPAGTSSSYLAEGATSAFFDEVVAVANPSDTPGIVLLRFMKSDGTVVPYSFPIAGLSRATVPPKQIAGLEHAEFSTQVEADVPVVVDRTMTWDAHGYGAHAEHGIPSPATVWYLAEGATHSGFNLFYLLMNPTTSAARVQVRYLLPAPAAPILREYTVAPNSRQNVWVNTEPGLAATDVSAVITSLDGVPIVVERAMYLDAGGQTFGAGHESAGVNAPSTTWFLAEGATGTYFDLFVLVANPNDQDAALEVTYLLPDGSTVVKAYTSPANSRLNIWVDFEDALLADTAVSTTVRSTNGVPVIVERAMWWPGTGWTEAHNSPGATEAGTAWALADGEVGGTRNVATYILLANTSPLPGQVRVTLLFEDGPTLTRTFDLLASSRFNVDVAAEFPEARGRRFGALVESLGDSPLSIVVERAMYSDAFGVTWAAGTNALATRLR